MYRKTLPDDVSTMPLSMSYGKHTNGDFRLSCEADGFAGLIGCLMRNPEYENIHDPKKRLSMRRSLAQKIANQIEAMYGFKRAHPGTAIDTSSDFHMIRSLERCNFVALGPIEMQGFEI